MPRIDFLADADLRTESFLGLLRVAAGQDDGELHRLIRDVLPGMTTVGISGDTGVVAFGTCRLTADANVLEYLAVEGLQRGLGTGSALVRFIQALHPMLPLVAETEDDAVGFYRRLGFTIESASPDPRWPGRRRYRCTLPPLSAA